MSTADRSTKMRDRDVRTAVLKKVIADHVADPSTRVIEELGLEHGACRVDIAVVNGFLHGYELKSDSDTLSRLPLQIEAYSKVLDRATLIAGEKHINAALDLLPNWWGIKVATRGPRGAVHIETIRPVSNNPSASPVHIAQLLWRDEVAAILEGLGVEKKALRTNRAGLYSLLTTIVSLVELRQMVRERLKLREAWRRPVQRGSHDDLLRHLAM